MKNTLKQQLLALNKLQPLSRRVYLLKMFEGLEDADIEALLGIDSDTIKSLLDEAELLIKDHN